MKRNIGLLTGIAATLAAGALWHGPLGGGERFESGVEAHARRVLDHYEMTQVDAQLAESPLRRTLLLSGPADDFQRSELLRMMDELPGVANVHWIDSKAKPPFQLPLIAEAELLALAGFGLGLLLAYLFELRRRARAEWRW